MKKADIIFISVMLAVAILFLCLFNVFSKKGATAKIYINNHLEDELALNTNTTKTYETEKGYNTITIKDGSVFVEAADCKNQVCVKKGEIENKGATIACTPHLFLVEVE